MQFVPLALFIISLAFYFYGKRVLALMSIIFIATNCFGFISVDRYILSPTDAILAAVLLISFFEWKHNCRYFCVKGDSVGKVIMIILVFLAFQFLRTVLLGLDSLIFAFKTVRIQGILLLYFFCRTLSRREYASVFKLTLLFSVIQGIFYYLQPLGLNVLQGVNNDIVAEEHRYANCPVFAPYFILCFWGWNRSKFINNIIWLLFFFGMIIMAQTRGVIIALGICILIAAIYSENKKKIISTIFVLLLFLIFAIPVFKARSEGGVGVVADIGNIMSASQDGIDLTMKSQSGSMAFRILMLLERGTYLIDNPTYAPLGVGAIHEASPANRFDFVFGTSNELYSSGKCQIDSGDITWVPIMLRYGFLGLVFFFSLLVCWIVRSARRFKSESLAFICAACLMSVYMTISSFDTTLFDSYSSLTFLCLYLGMSNTNTTILKETINFE